MADDNKGTEKQANLVDMVNRSYEKGLITLKQQNALIDKIVANQLRSESTVLKAVISEEKRKDIMLGQEKIEARKLALAEQELSVGKDLASTLSNQLSSKRSLEVSMTNLGDMSKDQVATAKENIKQTRANIKAQYAGADLTKQQQKTYNEILKNLDAEEGILNNIDKLLATGQAQKLAGAYEDATAKAEELGGKVNELFDKIPGGGFLAKALGLDDAAKRLTGGVNAGFQAMNAHIAQGGTMMGGLTAGVKAFNKALMVNPLLLVVAAGAALFTMLSKAEAEERELAEATGMTVAEARNLTHETEQYVGNPLKRQLATSKDILEVQKNMISEMGSMGRLATGVAQQVAESGKAFGYGAQEAAKVQSSFMSMGASAQGAADAQDELAANAIKAGVNVGQVMKDVAENSEAAMAYMGGNVEEIGKAAVKAAKLGVSLGTMTKVADKLLDIEGSLTAQFEFQALSGKNINLDKARQLALEGKIAEATESVFEQVGSIEEFNKMGVHERKKLAEATGMEVGELAKGLAIQKHRGKLTKDEMAAANGLNISAEKLQKMKPEEIKAEIAKQRAAEKSTAAFQELITSLKTAFMPLAEALGSILATFAPLLQVVSIPLKLIGKVFGFLFNGMGIFSTLLKGVVMYMGLMWLKTQLMGGKKGFGGFVGKITAAIKSMFGLKKATAQTADETNRINDDMDKAGKSAKSLKDRFKGMKSSIGGLFKKGGMKNLMGSIKGGVGGLVQKAGGLGGMAKIAGGGIAMAGMSSMMSGGGIPGFATGGEVGSTGIAKVHEGEMITPASKVPGSEPGGGGGGGIDYDKMTQAFIAAMQQMPAPQVNMDGAKISESVSANQSYDKGIK